MLGLGPSSKDLPFLLKVHRFHVYRAFVVIGLAFVGLVVFGSALSAYAACSNPSPLPSGYAAPGK
jgi:hypothetical protein